MLARPPSRKGQARPSSQIARGIRVLAMAMAMAMAEGRVLTNRTDADQGALDIR